ncbi:interleukin-4 receptor subunit alpha-like isoform X2 [Narcine bancroftii]|uniref:interleukin-4 receptor subunit alpha-like isoform X2 n=1 Tax=Narcine bancroftii TaxID=1343680 RepID=UPI003831F8BF
MQAVAQAGMEYGLNATGNNGCPPAHHLTFYHSTQTRGPGMVIGYLSIIAFWLCQDCEAHLSEQLECFNDYIEEMTCSWPVVPGTDCSTDYLLWYQTSLLELQNVTDIKNLLGSVCQCKISGQSLVYGSTYKIKVYLKGIVFCIKDIKSSQTIKPLAPYNLTISTTKDKEAFLVWRDVYSNENIDMDMEYQVGCMKAGGNWKILSSTKQRKLMLKTLLEPGYTYHMKVCSRPTHSYSGVWSEWSPVCQWTYDSSEWISPTLIVFVCIFIPLPAALCYYAFQLVKKSWWEKIPSPLKSSVSKQVFNKPQVKGSIFNENKIDDCKVEKISCMTEVSQERSKVEDTTEQHTESFPLPAFQHSIKDTKHEEWTTFAHFPDFGFPGLMDFPSLFPLPIADLSLVPTDAPGYSLFNSVAKDQWVEKEDGYHPFTRDEDGDLPLMLSTYSMSPGPSQEPPESSEPDGYRNFDSCVCKPWAKVVESGWVPSDQQIAETLLKPLDPVHGELAEYTAPCNHPFLARGCQAGKEVTFASWSLGLTA